MCNFVFSEFSVIQLVIYFTSRVSNEPRTRTGLWILMQTTSKFTRLLIVAIEVRVKIACRNYVTYYVAPSLVNIKIVAV